jgi:hypothetical protein
VRPEGLGRWIKFNYLIGLETAIIIAIVVNPCY